MIFDLTDNVQMCILIFFDSGGLLLMSISSISEVKKDITLSNTAHA